MKYGIARLVVACILVLSAGLGARAARDVKLSSQRRLAQAAQLGFVPQGCQGLQFTVTGYHGYSWGPTPIVYGKVVISNPQNFPIPLQQVQVQANNDIPVAPITTTAHCYSSSVPAASTGFGSGTLTCKYSINLPNNGVAAGPSHWPSVMATATISMSGATCSSAVTQISTSWWARLEQGLVNYFNPSSAGTGAPQGLTATSNGGRRLSQVDDLQLKNDLQLAKDGSLASVPAAALKGIAPPPCLGITFSKVTANSKGQETGASSIVSGTVVISTPASAPVALDQVVVQAFTNAPSVAPPSTAATCGATSADGTITCTYQMQVPNSPLTPGLAIRPSVQAVATAHGRTGSCYSAITPINYA